MIRAVAILLLLVSAVPASAGCEPASYYKRFKGGCNNPASWWVNRGDTHITVTMTREPDDPDHGAAMRGSGMGPRGYVGKHR